MELQGLHITEKKVHPLSRETAGVVAISQPTFFPWIGYFALMEQVETFVFLDSVQFAKRSWQQRNRIKTPNGPQWITVPVFSKGLRDQDIKDVEVNHDERFADKLIGSLRANYARAPFFKAYSEELFSVISKKQKHLSQLNIDIIHYFGAHLGLKCKFLLSSEFDGVLGAKADLLAQISERLEAKHYLSAVGSKEYMDQSTAFQDKNISVSYNTYEPTEYPQLFGAFEPFLSVVDLLFNVGPRSREVMLEGLK